MRTVAVMSRCLIGASETAAAASETYFVWLHFSMSARIDVLDSSLSCFSFLIKAVFRFMLASSFLRESSDGRDGSTLDARRALRVFRISMASLNCSSMS